MYRDASSAFLRASRCQLSKSRSSVRRIYETKPQGCINLIQQQLLSSRASATKGSPKHNEPRGFTRKTSIDASWKRIKERLLDHSLYPPGSYGSQQWNEAQQSLMALKPQLHAKSPNAIAEGFAILDRLCLELRTPRKRKSEVNLPLPVDLLYLPVDAWRRCGSKKTQGDVVFSTREIISKVEDYNAVGLFSFYIRISNMLIDAIGKIEAPSEAPVSAERMVLEPMLQRSGPEDETHPNAATINGIIHLWSQSGRTDAPNAVETHLRRLKEWHKQTGREDQRPDVRIYASMISTWARSGHQDAPQRAEELLQEAESMENVDVNVVVYSTVIQALARSRQEGAAERAQSWLNEMLRHYSGGNTAVKPNVWTFSSVIAAYGRSEKADKAEALLDEMEARYQRTGDSSFCPNAVCYGAVIDAFARLRQPYRAEAVLRRMLQQSESGNELATPNIIVFNSVLKAWANSGEEKAADRAIELLHQLEDLYRNGNKMLRPNVITYSSLLDCFARSPSPQKYTSIAEELFLWMDNQEDADLQPDEIAYLKYLMVLRAANQPERAEGLIERMVARYRKGASTAVPNTFHFNSAIAAWVRSGNTKAPEKVERLFRIMKDLHQKEQLDCEPNSVTFTTLIDCLGRLRDPDAPVRAENILRLMQKQFKEGDKLVKPTEVSYLSVISAWARSKRRDACTRAESLLWETMDQGIKPNARIFNTVMAAFARHGRPDKVEALFREMNRTLVGSKPHFPVYVTRLQAWARAGEPDRAASVLEEILSTYEAGDLDGKPTVREFNAVVQAWLRSRREDAAEKAEKALNTMHELAASGRFDCCPDSYTYGCVISAYAQSGATDAAERVYDLLQRLHRLRTERKDPSCSPNIVIYSEVISTIARVSSSISGDRIEELISDMNQIESRHWQDSKQHPALHKLMASLANTTITGRDRYVLQLRNILESKKQAAL